MYGNFVRVGFCGAKRQKAIASGRGNNAAQSRRPSVSACSAIAVAIWMDPAKSNSVSTSGRVHRRNHVRGQKSKKAIDVVDFNGRIPAGATNRVRNLLKRRTTTDLVTDFQRTIRRPLGTLRLIIVDGCPPIVNTLPVLDVNEGER